MRQNTVTENAQVVMLCGGLDVSLGALELLWSLENRGLTVCLSDEGFLLVGPKRHLDAGDRAAIVRYRDELKSLVRYCENPPRVM